MHETMKASNHNFTLPSARRLMREKHKATATKRVFKSCSAVLAGTLLISCSRTEKAALTSGAQKTSLLADLAQTTEPSVNMSIARANMLCASGMGSRTSADLESCQSVVAPWAQRVRAETQRHAYRFRQNPAAFEHSENFFKMLMLTVVLTEDFQVHYKEDLKSEPIRAKAYDGFFANSDDVFLTGLVGPKREGTCSSMPVLYVAIGRELGYPLKLVTTKGHMFVRWEGQGERFNIEATAHGLSRFDDEYYRHWPFEITPEEEAAEGYLKSLTPSEELAAFLSIRGMCLREGGRISEAADAFAAAARLAPGCRSYRTMLASLQKQLRNPNLNPLLSKK